MFVYLKQLNLVSILVNSLCPNFNLVILINAHLSLTWKHDSYDLLYIYCIFILSQTAIVHHAIRRGAGTEDTEAVPGFGHHRRHCGLQ